MCVLWVARIPHVLVGGRSPRDREEIIALRHALVAIEWPGSELRVFATQRVRFLPSATKRSSPSDSKRHSYGILPCQI
jgi:hypothetical protein